MIRINSVIINLLLFPPLLLPAAGMKQDFSEQIPGQPPDGWVSVWQRPVDDVIYVTNAGEPSHPGKRQMVIDRTIGDDHSYYRYSRSFTLKNMGNAGAVLAEFRFKAECSSTSSAPFEMDFGSGGKGVVSLNFVLRNWGPNVFLYPVCLPTWTDNWNAKKQLGNFEKNRWQKIRLLMPFGKNTGLKQCYGILYDSGGKPGKTFAVPATRPMEERSAVSIVPGNKKKGARLWFTDFSIVPATEKQIREFTSAE